MRPGQDGEPAEGTGESADPAGDTGSSSYAPGGQGEATENSRTDAEGKTGTADGAFAVGSAAGPAATAERPKPPGSADTAATVVRAKPERPEGTRVALSPSGSVWPDVPAAVRPRAVRPSNSVRHGRARSRGCGKESLGIELARQLTGCGRNGTA